MKKIALLGLLLLSNFSFLSAQNETCSWERDDHAPYEDLHFPDTYVSYWRYRFRVEKGRNIKLKMDGNYPHARYFAFNVYNQRLGNQIDGISDENIEPLPGNSNPFQKNVLRHVEERSYTLWVKANFASEKNTLKLPPSNEEEAIVDIWYRVYLPDENLDPAGGVGLPLIRAYDEKSGLPVSCPIKHVMQSVPSGRAGVPPSNRGKQIYFYETLAEGDYGNFDNKYSLAKLDFGNENELAVIKLKAPSFSDTYSGQFLQLSNSANVRYWSLCLVGMSAEVSSCLADSDALIDQEGNFTLVVGPEEIKEKVRERGLNFIPRGNRFLPILIYRNLLSANFEKCMKGEYAPHGEYYSVKKFEEFFKTTGSTLQKGITSKYVHYDSQAAAPSTRTLRVGISLAFFIPEIWYKNITGEKIDQAQLAATFNSMKKYLEDEITGKTGVPSVVEVSMADVLASKLTDGKLDLGLFVGFEYPWINRFYGALAPLLFGVREGGIHESHSLLVRKEWMNERGILPGEGSLQSLKGLPLSIGKLKISSLFALYKALLDSNLEPESFLKLPKILNQSFPSAPSGSLDAMLHSLVGRTANADVALIDSYSLGVYTSVFPSVRARLEIFKNLSPTPGALVLYHPGKIQSGLEETLDKLKEIADRKKEGFLDKSSTTRLFGFSEFKTISPKLSEELSSFTQSMRYYPEYFLPVQLYEFGKLWKKVE